MTFTPLKPLPPTTQFSAHLEPGVRDAAGNELTQASQAFSFTTVGEPQVVDSEPAADATDVSLDASVSITFSTLMDTSSAVDALKLSPQFAHKLRWNGERLTIVPDGPLVANRQYTLTLDQTARDLGGTRLQQPFSLSFSTVAPGLVVRTLMPADGSDGVAVTSSIAVDFDRALDPGSVNNELLQISPAIPGSLEVITAPGAAGLGSAERRMLRFQPSGPLPPNTTFEVTLGTGLRGADGSRLAAPLTWTFLTGAPMATLGNQIVYLSDRSGVANLWAMNPDGTGRRQLSAELSPVVDYAVSPDGRSFVVGDGERLIEQRADGSVRQVLTDEGVLEFDPAYSPNGAQLAFGRADRATGAGQGLWVRDVGGGDAHRLELPPELTASATPTPSASAESPDSGLLRAPRYSPDGQALAFVDEHGRVDVLELPGARLTTAPFVAVEPPVWLTDSSGLLLSGLAPDDVTAPSPPVAGEPVLPLALERAGLSPAERGQLRVVRLDRGAATVAATGLPPGVAGPAADASGRVAYLLLNSGSTHGAPWLAPRGEGPGRSLLVNAPVSSVRFTPDPDRLLLATDTGTQAGGIWLFNIADGVTDRLGNEGWMPRWVP